MLKNSLCRFSAAVIQNPIVVTPNPIKSTPIQALLRDYASSEYIGVVELASKVFGAPIRKDIIHRCIVWELACKRKGTASTKGISDIRGTTKKPWGTGIGKARAGSLRAPQFRGGAIIHGPKPRSFAYHLPRKIREYGMRSIFSAKYAQDELSLVQEFNPPNLKTVTTKGILDQFFEMRPQTKKILLVSGGEFPFNAKKGSDNLPHVLAMSIQDIRFHHLLNYDQVVLDLDAIKAVQKRLSDE